MSFPWLSIIVAVPAAALIATIIDEYLVRRVSPPALQSEQAA